MNADIAPLLETSVEIEAPPAAVWALVSDLPRLAEWSPQVVRSRVRGGGAVREGARLRNLNRRGPLFWPTNSKVLAFEPHRLVSFVVTDNRSVWSFEVEPTGTGSRLTHRRETPRGLSGVSIWLTDKLFGGQKKFAGELEQGMARTIARVKAEAEG